MSLSENIAKIRNSVYGKDVREAIAASIEDMDTNAANAVTQAAASAVSSAQGYAQQAAGSAASASSAEGYAQQAAASARAAAESAASIGTPTNEQTASAVSSWLNVHPEATTTVQDGALTSDKFSNDLKLHTLKDYVTPQMYGAKGNGVDDDTEAIQNAINNATNIMLPKGTYKITSPITISQSGKYIFGLDKYHTKILCDNTDAFHLSRDVERCTMKSFAVFGDNSEHSCVVFAMNSVHWRFEDLWVRYFGDSFFLSNNNGHTNNIYFLNCQFEDGGKSAIEFVNNANRQINNIIIDNSNISNFTYGVIVTGNNIKVMGCTIQACEVGILVDPQMSKDESTADKNYSSISIISNYFEQCYRSYIEFYCGYKNNTIMFGYGITILNNYGSYKYKTGITSEEKAVYDTYPCVLFKNVGSNMYDNYNVQNGGVLCSVLYASNYFVLKQDSKILIDTGDMLEADSVIIADGIGGNTNQGYGTEPYTIKNMANATVISKYNFVKKIVKMCKQYFPSNSTVDVDGATSDTPNFIIDVPYNGIQKVEFKYYNYTTEPITISVYGYSKNGGKTQMYTTTFTESIGEHTKTFDNWVFTGNTLKGYKNTLSYTIVVKSEGKMVFYNPVVYALESIK